MLQTEILSTTWKAWAFLTLTCCLLAACETCEPNPLPEVLGDESFFVRYKSPDGQALSSAHESLRVYKSLKGHRAVDIEYQPVSFAARGDTIGPFNYLQDFYHLPTQQYNTLLLDDVVYKMDYYFHLDGQVDTVGLEFWVEVDRCERKWGFIRYYFNGEASPFIHNRQNPNIIILKH